MAQKKSSTVRKKTVSKTSKAKSVAAIQPKPRRISMWVISAAVVAALGFFLSWLLSYNGVFITSDASMVSVLFGVIGTFLVFYAGFALLGKFGLYRAPLAFLATLAFFVDYLLWGAFGYIVSSWFWPMEIAIREGQWITPESALSFAAAFLLVASAATLLQTGLQRQRHSLSTVAILIAVAASSAFVIVF